MRFITGIEFVYETSDYCVRFPSLQALRRAIDMQNIFLCNIRTFEKRQQH